MRTTLDRSKLFSSELYACHEAISFFTESKSGHHDHASTWPCVLPLQYPRLRNLESYSGGMKSRFFLQRRETMLLSEGTEATSAGGLSPPISPCRIAANTDSSFILTEDQNQEGPHQETLISIWTPPSKIMSKWTSLQNKISKGTSPSTIFDHHYLEFNVPSYRRVFP